MPRPAHYWNTPYIDWKTELPDGWTLYICRIRPSRSRARVPAVVEALSLLGAYHPLPLLSGPLADQKGVFWIALPAPHEPDAEALLPYLGYTRAVSKLVAVQQAGAERVGPRVYWRGVECALKPVYVEDRDWLRSRAPDRRAFMLRDHDGRIVPVKGYRGDSGALSRRGLPPEDARLLVNLARPQPASPGAARLLDPFAGVGGVVIEALDQGYRVFSGDIDPVVQHGLSHFGAFHSVLDAARLPFAGCAFHAIAAELPFERAAEPLLDAFMGEVARVLAAGGKAALMLVEWQTEPLLRAAEARGLALTLAADIDRKGRDAVVCAWRKG